MRRVGSGGTGGYGQHTQIANCEPESNDFEIQEVILMPAMRLDAPLVVEEPPVAPKEPAPVSNAKTTFVLQQLGQITIALPKVVKEKGETESEAATNAVVQ